MATNYTLRLRLMQLLGSRVIDVEDADGIMEKGVFIPLEMNGLHVTNKGNVALYAYVTERMAATRDNSTHYLKLKVTKDKLKKLDELGYSLPFIGEMTPSNVMPKHQRDYYNSDERVKVDNSFYDNYDNNDFEDAEI